ncbi:MAG TPA: response regulator transcription factor [Candidatus Acidoferrum sp.]
MTRPRLMMADDHTILVEAFRKLLDPYYDVVATVSDGRSLLERAPQVNPEVIIVDIGMPLMNGLDAAVRLKQVMPHVKLVFLTMNDDPDLAVEAMRCGASAYLLKSSAAEELIKAIQMALKSQRYVTPLIARGMENSFIENPGVIGQGKTLTPRQREVVQLLAEGKSMKQAADILTIKERTVAFHKYRVMHRFNLGTSAELVQFAIKSRIFVH